LRPEGREVKKVPKQDYTTEFKEQAVKHAQVLLTSRAKSWLGNV
jgi:hypothetical protein